MRRAALRIAILVVLGGVVIAAASAAGLFWLAQGAAPPVDGRLMVAGLEQPVSIVRDPFGVPHVEAQTLADAFCGLGLAHAQDRLWQMDLLRRHARGTLSELFGSNTVGPDRLARTLGLKQAAERELATLPDSVHTLLEAYSRGVNAWIGEVRARRVARPFEMRWLGHEIADWRPVDTLAVLRFRSWALSRTLGASLLLQGLKESISGTVSRDFFPEPPIESEPGLIGSLERLGRVADAWAAGAGLDGPVGSLAFIVGAGRTARGFPILVNDSHLEFELPPLPFFAHLRTPDLEVAGTTWPGLPVFLSGTNRRVAWGQVSLHASTSDLFNETLHPSEPRYDLNGRWLETERREERIEVRWRGVLRVEVASTRHGPLLGSALPHDPKVKSYALRWVGQDRRSGIRSLLELQRAGDWDEFRAALRSYPAPAATFVYADTDGNIGEQVAGLLPIRTVLQGGFLPLPGRTRRYDWRGFIAFDDLPSRFGANLPWLVVSSRPRGRSFPHRVAWLWSSTGGAERVRARLRGAARLELEDVLEIQRERHSARGSELVQSLLDGATGLTERGARVRSMLLEWNGDTDTDSIGAAVYHAFRERLIEQLLEARLDGHGPLAERLRGDAEPAPGLLLDRFLERVGREQSREWIDAALENTWSWLGVNVSSNPRNWGWGKVHRLHLEHPFERLGGPLLSRLGRLLGRGPFPAPGDPDSVWAMHRRELPTPATVGPVVRYAVDLADPDHAQVGLAGGQSGHPGTPHYDDAASDWLRGRPRPLWMHRQNIAFHEQGRWELHPHR